MFDTSIAAAIRNPITDDKGGTRDLLVDLERLAVLFCRQATQAETWARTLEAIADYEHPTQTPAQALDTIRTLAHSVL